MGAPGMVAMTVLGAMGGYKSAAAQRQQAADEQSYYNFLAAQDEARAATALKRGTQEVTAIEGAGAVAAFNRKREISVVKGAQQAAIGASGLSSGSVTAEDIARDTQRVEDMDETAIRYNADSKAWEAQTGAQDTASALRGQATSYRLAGANARRAGDTNADASLLGSATSVARNWFDFGTTSMGRRPRTVSVPRGGGYPIAPDYGVSYGNV